MAGRTEPHSLLVSSGGGANRGAIVALDDLFSHKITGVGY
jgi:hypothetical protein